MSAPSLTDILAENLLSDDEHKRLDVDIINFANSTKVFALKEFDWLVFIVQQILIQAPKRANLRELSIDDVRRSLNDGPVFKIVQEAASRQDFKNVRNLAAFRMFPVVSPGVGTSTVASGDDQNATMRSWESPFIGEAHKALYGTISKVCRDPAQHIYARLLAIIQSSGMGKSRAVDELSKEHFVIPINLRTKGIGFPPGDQVVSSFLVHDPFTPEDATHRAQAFLISLFEITTKVVSTLDFRLANIISNMPPADHPTSTAQKFRLFMTFGQRYWHHGKLRQDFYCEVIDRAEQILNLPLETGIGMGTLESKSDMDTAEDLNTEPHSSPIRNFIEGGKPLTLRQSALELIRVLAPAMPLAHESLQSKPPLIVLAYDEAHELSFPKNEDNPRAPTALSQHRRVIQGLRTLPIFALVLSTTGKVQDLTPPPKYQSSDRLLYLYLRSLPPFSALGFDQMVKAIAFPAGGESYGINDVSTIGFMVLFGRPLWGSRYKYGILADKIDIVQFARQKLMQGKDLENPSSSAKLALMSVRLALEFKAKTTEARALEMEQVEKYMRVRFPVHKSFETAVTISPSEPILAEAARQYMGAYRSTFNIPASLIEHLTTMGLDKGDRGELVAQVILILAADKACERHLATAIEQPPTLTVPSRYQPTVEMPTVQMVPRAFSVELFIKELLGTQWSDDVLHSIPAKWRTKTESSRKFQTAFKDARIYFNHFVKLDDPGVVNREFLWRLVLRGSVALCANCQDGINIIAPIVFGTGPLCRSTISALFVQVENDKSFKAHPNTLLFDLMNPYLVRFFDMDEEKPLPIIRMVFAFGSPTAAVKVIPQYEERPPRKAKTNAQKAARMSPRYTSYDIWCAKASSETFGVIKEDDEQHYALLLKTDKVFPQAYYSGFGIEEIESIRRSMNPGTSVKAAHWAFCDASIPQPPAEDLADGVDFGEEGNESEE